MYNTSDKQMNAVTIFLSRFLPRMDIASSASRIIANNKLLYCSVHSYL